MRNLPDLIQGPARQPQVTLVLVRTAADRPAGRVKLPAGIDQGSVSRASTRMHVGKPGRDRVGGIAGVVGTCWGCTWSIDSPAVVDLPAAAAV